MLASLGNYSELVAGHMLGWLDEDMFLCNLSDDLS